jgi:lysophospholipase L1-like esterase
VRRCRRGLLFIFVVAAQLVSPVAAEGPPASHWEGEIRAFERLDAERPPPRGAVLFIGSSSVRLWKLNESFPELRTINRGFGGSQLADSTRFVDRIAIPYRPRWIVLYAGDNDLAAGKRPEQVLADFKQFVAKVQRALPETRIAYLAIKPSIKRWALVDRIRETNAAIEQFIDQDRRLKYVDIFGPMLGADGQPRKELFREDGLHMNAEGYKVWASALRPAIEDAR